MKTIKIELLGEHNLDGYSDVTKKDILILNKKSFLGGEHVTEIICVLGPAMIVLLAKILVNKIKNEKLSSIKIEGDKIHEFDTLEISGVSQKFIEEILNKYNNNGRANNTPTDK